MKRLFQKLLQRLPDYLGIGSVAGALVALIIICNGCGGGGGGVTKAPNKSPQVSASVSPGTTVQVGQIVTFDASASTDAETASASLKFRYDLDGNGWDGASSTTRMVTTTYPTAKDYSVRIAVSDEEGAVSEATMTITAVACMSDLACNDNNSNTIDTCTVAKACDNRVSRAIEVNVNTDPNMGNVSVDKASVTVKDASGATVLNGTTDASGRVMTGNLGAGDYTVTAVKLGTSVPHFTAPTAKVVTVASTGSATASFIVTPEYAITLGAINVNDFAESFNGGTYNLSCQGYSVTQTAATATTIFVDMPYAVGCTATVTNPESTIPGMVTDVVSSVPVTVTADNSFTVTAAKPFCIIDANCPIPIGMTTPVCLDAGKSNASCGAYKRAGTKSCPSQYGATVEDKGNSCVYRRAK
jgi:hypothetical protein